MAGVRPAFVLLLSLSTACGSRTGVADDGIFASLPNSSANDASNRDAANRDTGARDAEGDSYRDAASDVHMPDGLDACKLSSVAFEQLRPVVMLLIDQSGSMRFRYPASSSTGTRWSVVRDALMDPDTGVIKQLESSVRFGVTFFTSHLGFEGGTCPVLSDVAAATDNYDNIKALYDQTYPDGDTPTGESVSAASDILLAMPGSGPKSILLVTDGVPDTCAVPNGDDEGSQRVAVTKTQNAFARGVTSYVLGISDDIAGTNLQQLANAGQGKSIGLVFGRDRGAVEAYRATDNVGDLAPQIVQILKHVPLCEIRIQGNVDPNQAGKGKVILDGQELVFDDPNGWQLRDTQTLELLGKACDAARAKGRDLTVKLSCGDPTEMH